MRLFLSGGCKNGKSTLAQRLTALQGEERVYIATMRARDAEDDARIARHRAEREGWGFETVECFTRIEGLVGRFPPGASLLLDSVTALLAEEMFGAGAEPDGGAPGRVIDGLTRLVERYEHIVIVSDFLYSDAIGYHETTEMYRRGLAAVDRTLAAQCDAVVEVAFGQCIAHKGAGEVATLFEKAGLRAVDGAGLVYGAAGADALG